MSMYCMCPPGFQKPACGWRGAGKHPIPSLFLRSVWDEPRLIRYRAGPIDILNEHHFIALLVIEQLVDTILDQQHTKTPWP
jgi:hypothetical protein